MGLCLSRLHIFLHFGLGGDKTSKAAKYNRLFLYFRCDWAPGVASVLDPAPSLKRELYYCFPESKSNTTKD